MKLPKLLLRSPSRQKKRDGAAWTALEDSDSSGSVGELEPDLDRSSLSSAGDGSSCSAAAAPPPPSPSKKRGRGGGGGMTIRSRFPFRSSSKPAAADVAKPDPDVDADIEVDGALALAASTETAITRMVESSDADDDEDEEGSAERVVDNGVNVDDNCNDGEDLGRCRDEDASEGDSSRYFEEQESNSMTYSSSSSVSELYLNGQALPLTVAAVSSPLLAVQHPRRRIDSQSSELSASDASDSLANSMTYSSASSSSVSEMYQFGRGHLGGQALQLTAVAVSSSLLAGHRRGRGRADSSPSALSSSESDTSDTVPETVTDADSMVYSSSDGTNSSVGDFSSGALPGGGGVAAVPDSLLGKMHGHASADAEESIEFALAPPAIMRHHRLLPGLHDSAISSDESSDGGMGMEAAEEETIEDELPDDGNDGEDGDGDSPMSMLDDHEDDDDVDVAAALSFAFAKRAHKAPLVAQVGNDDDNEGDEAKMPQVSDESSQLCDLSSATAEINNAGVGREVETIVSDSKGLASPPAGSGTRETMAEGSAIESETASSANAESENIESAAGAERKKGAAESERKTEEGANSSRSNAETSGRTEEAERGDPAEESLAGTGFAEEATSMDDDRRVKGARSRSDGKYRRCDSCRGGACSCLPSPDDFLGGVPSSICFSSNFLEEEEEEQRRRQHQRGRDVEEEVVEDKEEAIPSNSDDVSLAGAAVDWSSVGAEGDGGSSSSSSSSLLEWEEIEARGSGGAAPGSAFPQWREDVGDDGKEDHIAALTGLAGPAGGSFRTPPPPEFRKNAPRDYDGRTEGDGGGGNDGAAKARSRSATPETIPDTPSSTRPTVAGTGTGARGEGDAPAGRRRIDFDEEECRGPADGGAGETKSMVKKKKGRKGHGLNRILKSLRRGG